MIHLCIVVSLSINPTLVPHYSAGSGYIVSSAYILPSVAYGNRGGYIVSRQWIYCIQCNHYILLLYATIPLWGDLNTRGWG